MHISSKYGVLFTITKFGFLYSYEISSASLIFKTRVIDSPVFIGAKNSQTDGIYVVAKNGAVISVNVDP